MKIFISVILIFLNFIITAQTKSDLLSSLEQVFSHQEFQPAFNSDLSTRGCLIVKMPKPNFRRTISKANSKTFQDLTKEDFFGSKHNVRLISKEELEYSGISKDSILRINTRGNDQEIFINLYTTITNEAKAYTRKYVLVKENLEWKILKHSVSKRGTKIRHNSH